MYASRMASVDVPAVESMREVEGVGVVLRALGGAFKCWTDDAESLVLLPMDRPVRLEVDIERAEDGDGGPRLVSWEALPLPVPPAFPGVIKVLDLAGYRRRLRGRRGA